MRTLKRDTGTGIISRNIPDTQFGKLISDLIEFTNNWPFMGETFHITRKSDSPELTNPIGNVDTVGG